MSQPRFYMDFGADIWDMLRGYPCRENSTVSELVAMTKASGVANPVTPSRFKRFERLVKSLDPIETPWRNPLLAFIHQIKRGDYRNEFRYMTNRKGHGNISQAGEMFSHFRQAIRYGSIS
jgi:hypothetical protein